MITLISVRENTNCTDYRALPQNPETVKVKNLSYDTHENLFIFKI